MSCKGKTGAALKACQKAAKDRLAKKAANATNAVVGEVQKVGNFFKRTFNKTNSIVKEKTKNLKNRRAVGKKRRAVRNSRKKGLDRNAIN